MSSFDNPFDDEPSRNREGCTCGYHSSQQEHAAAIAAYWQQREQSLQTIMPSGDERHRRAVHRVTVFGKARIPASAKHPNGRR